MQSALHAWRRAGATVHLGLPGALTAILAFRAGGFFPDVTGAAAAGLAVLLVALVTLAAEPAGGLSRLLMTAAAALAGFAVWVLVSFAWSDSPARALAEFDRPLLYLLVLVLVGTRAARPGALGTVLRWTAAAIVVVCLAALATRLLPGSFPAEANYRDDRLSFPITYWNALGILTAIGAVLCSHLSASETERPLVRAAAAGALPVIATTLYLTFSRGGIAAAAVGLALYALLARPRPLLSVALTALPATALALWAAYRADLLARADYTTDAAASQGSELAFVVLACTAGAILLRAVALRADRRLVALRLAPRRRAPALVALAALVLLSGTAVAVAVDLPERLEDARRSFVEGDTLSESADLRDRLTQVGNNGRIVGWRVAADSFQTHPWHGTGAGTFRLEWERDRRPPAFKINDAHSLYLEVLGELGLVGLALLLVTFGALLFAGLRGLRGPERHAHAAFVAAGLVLLLHAGVDWDWEMPALFAWFFGAGAAAAAAREGRPGAGGGGRLPRVATGIACLVLAVTPALVAASEVSLRDSLRAFSRNDCGRAVDAALDSIERLGVRAQPYEILGYCDARGGADRLAVGAMRAARARDPDNWQYAYGLAVTQALAGQDPRPAAALARRLNPLERLARDLQQRLAKTREPARWRRIAARADIPAE